MDKNSLIRTIILVVALANMVLTSCGYSPLPIDDELITMIVSSIFTAVISIWAWWKNNYISRTGQEQKRVLQAHGLYKK